MWRRKQERPPSTYEGVRLVAEVLSRINAELIERYFSVPGDTATEYMVRLVADNLYGDVQATGWHYPKKYQKPFRESRPKRQPKAADRVPVDADKSPTSTPETEYVVELEEEVQALKARIKRFQVAGKTVIAQREQWRARGLAAEKILESDCNRRTDGDNRFDALRRLVAKELHPDFCTGGHLEKLMRQECFKRLWPEIERLDEQK
jgi:hypothetical protein